MQQKHLNSLLVFLFIFIAGMLSTCDAGSYKDENFFRKRDTACGYAETKEELNKCLEKFNLIKEQARTEKQATKEYYERELREQKEIDEKNYQEKLRELREAKGHKTFLLCVLSAITGVVGSSYMNDNSKDGRSDK